MTALSNPRGNREETSMDRAEGAAMVKESERTEVPAGASFLMTRAGETPFLVPEHFSNEQLEFHRAVQEFSDNEIVPRIPEIEAKKPGLIPELLRKAGALGFLMVDIPEEHGGIGADKT